VERRPPGASRLGKEVAALQYRLVGAGAPAPWPSPPPLPGVREWQRDGDDLLVTLDARPGVSVGVRDLLAALETLGTHPPPALIRRTVLLGSDGGGTLAAPSEP